MNTRICTVIWLMIWTVPGAYAATCNTVTSVSLDFANAVPDYRPEEKKDFLPSIGFDYYGEQLNARISQREPGVEYRAKLVKGAWSLNCERSSDHAACPTDPGPLYAVKSTNPTVLRLMGFVMVDRGELRVCKAKGRVKPRDGSPRSLDFPEDPAQLAAINKNFEPDCASAHYGFTAAEKFRYHAVGAQKVVKRSEREDAAEQIEAEAQIIIPHTRDAGRAGEIKFRPKESLISDCNGIRSIVPDDARVPGQYGGAASTR